MWRTFTGSAFHQCTHTHRSWCLSVTRDDSVNCHLISTTPIMLMTMMILLICETHFRYQWPVEFWVSLSFFKSTRTARVRKLLLSYLEISWEHVLSSVSAFSLRLEMSPRNISCCFQIVSQFSATFSDCELGAEKTYQSSQLSWPQLGAFQPLLQFLLTCVNRSRLISENSLYFTNTNKITLSWGVNPELWFCRILSVG